MSKALDIFVMGLAGFLLIPSKEAEAENGADIYEWSWDPTVLSKYLNDQDLTVSSLAQQYGITEQWNPPADIVANARHFAQSTLDPVLKLVYKRYPQAEIVVSSWWRSDPLGHKICEVYYGGPCEPLKPSDHHTGQAIDWQLFLNGQNRSDILARMIRDAQVPFKQLILERGTLTNPGNVHLAAVPSYNRHDTLFTPDLYDYSVFNLDSY